MSVAHLLPDFGHPDEPRKAAARSVEDLESLKLESFETGYKAGWEDSVKAQGEEASRISAELERSLQDLSFTYHEARSQLLSSLRPLLAQMVDMVLPELARESLVPRVAAELASAADAATAARVRILTASETLPALARLSDRDFGFPLDIAEDPTLGAGQVMLRFATEERLVDMDGLLSGIRAAVSGYFDEHLQESAHG